MAALWISRQADRSPFSLTLAGNFGTSTFLTLPFAGGTQVVLMQTSQVQTIPNVETTFYSGLTVLTGDNSGGTLFLGTNTSDVMALLPGAKLTAAVIYVDDGRLIAQGHTASRSLAVA